MTMLDETLMPTRELVKKFNIETLVETGCFYGHGLEFGQLFNLKSYSCDIVQRWADECTQKFPEALVHHSDSVTFLEKILPILGPTPTLFWLDAHFPVKYAEVAGIEGFTETESERFPEFQEMQLIKKLKQGYENDVIMMDDVWCVADKENELYDPNLIPNETYTAHTVKELSAVFADTHDCSIVKLYSGVLVFTPKEK